MLFGNLFQSLRHYSQPAQPRPEREEEGKRDNSSPDGCMNYWMKQSRSRKSLNLRSHGRGIRHSRIKPQIKIGRIKNHWHSLVNGRSNRCTPS